MVLVGSCSGGKWTPLPLRLSGARFLIRAPNASASDQCSAPGPLLANSLAVMNTPQLPMLIPTELGT